MKDEYTKDLTDEQKAIIVDKGTDAPHTGEYVNTTDEGSYLCAACGSVLFKSDQKYDSNCGWPSFMDVIDRANVNLTDDSTLGMKRTEVTCATCDGHLGHVFDDGPGPTGERFCINSTSIKLDKAKK
jgi:peptide-methionine (R)-S-oxide reductase